MTSVNPASSAQTQLPATALTSPYDGTVPTSLGVASTGTGITGAVPTLTGLGANGLTGGAANSGRQVNATNQTAIAPNGNVNQ